MYMFFKLFTKYNNSAYYPYYIQTYNEMFYIIKKVANKIFI